MLYMLHSILSVLVDIESLLFDFLLYLFIRFQEKLIQYKIFAYEFMSWPSKATRILLIRYRLVLDHWIYIEPSRSTARVILFNLKIFSCEGRTFNFLSWTSFLMKPEQLLLCGFSSCLVDGCCNWTDGMDMLN